MITNFVNFSAKHPIAWLAILVAIQLTTTRAPHASEPPQVTSSCGKTSEKLALELTLTTLAFAKGAGFEVPQLLRIELTGYEIHPGFYREQNLIKVRCFRPAGLIHEIGHSVFEKNLTDLGSHENPTHDSFMTDAYSELFSDLLAVELLKRSDAISKEVKHDFKKSIHQHERDFKRRQQDPGYSLVTDDSDSYNAADTVRTHLWNQFLSPNGFTPLRRSAKPGDRSLQWLLWSFFRAFSSNATQCQLESSFADQMNCTNKAVIGELNHYSGHRPKQCAD